MSSGVIIRRRVVLLFFMMTILLLSLSARLIWVQLVEGSELQQKALNNRLREVPVQAKRGTVYDRNGKELAISISSDAVYAIPPEVERSGQAEAIAGQLAAVLNMPVNNLLQKITQRRSFSWIARKISYQQAQTIRELNLPGIEILEEPQRYYPKETLAAHLLGFAGVDNQGLEGLEAAYDQELRGQPGKIVVEYDARGRELPQALHRYLPPQDGNDLYLTIDENLQFIVERELDTVMAAANSPKSANIIMMDPQTGELLAMASRPTYDPNSFGSFPSSAWRNTAVSNVYEPGSTFKIITIAAALEEGLVEEGETFYDPGYIKVGKDIIKCWRFPRAHGSQSFAEGVQNSCNPVFVTVGLRLEDKLPGKFYDYLESFGFGVPSGIDLPGEAKGIVIPRPQVKRINLATISIGQGIAVTPIQLITAAAAVANGGLLYKPQLVKQIVGKDGELLRPFNPQEVRRVISPETARRSAQLLEGVVAVGTGKNAYIEGFRVAGKTGTAQKAGTGGYQQGKYVASFLGFAPANDPRLVALVIMDEPQGYPYFGGTVAAPVFKRVMEDALRYLGVKPQNQEGAKPALETVEVPTVVTRPVDNAIQALTAVGLKGEVRGDGPVVLEQTPVGGAIVNRGTTILLSTLTNTTGNLVPVPDVTGKKIAEATYLLATLELRLQAKGQGEAVEQAPVPGTPVLRGSMIQVEFQPPMTQSVLGP